MDNKYKQLCSVIANEIFLNPKNKTFNKIAALSASKPLDEKKSANGKIQVDNDIDAIGIWERKSDGTLLRDMKYYNEWLCWADVEKISAKKNDVVRIVLIGESTARAYFFDPVFNLAGYLEKLLNTNQLNMKYDVVDLARIDIDVIQVRDILNKVHILKPDYIWFFCGNNWLQIDNLNPVDLINLSDMLQKKQLIELQNYYVSKCLDPQILITPNLLKENARTTNVKNIITIPEFNLKEWNHDMFSQDIRLASSKKLDDLYELFEKKCENKNFEEAKLTLNKIVKLEKFSNPKSMEKLANIYLLQKNYDNAKIYFIKARDSVVGLPIKFSPRITAHIQNLLRKFPRENNYYLIDLPKIFSEQSETNIPGKDLFMDYCHLNLEGIKLVVSQVTKIFHECYKLKLDIDEHITLKDKAASYFVAAIHNAHYGQKIEVIDFYISQSISYDMNIKQIMKLFLQIYTRNNIPFWMSKEFIEICRYSNIIKHYLLPKDTNQIEFLNDSILKKSILDHINLEIHYKYDSYKVINLLRSHHWAMSKGETVNFDLSSKNAYFKALNQTSKFELFINNDSCFALKLCYALPYENEFQLVKISLNKNHIYQSKITNIWENLLLKIQLQKGVNIIKIEWPPVNKMKVFDKFRKSLQRYKIPPIFQCFGFIHTLELSLCDESNMLEKKKPSYILNIGH